MSRYATPMRLLCTTGLVALLGMAPGAGTGFAQSVNDMVRTLNNIVNPSDAKRFDDQARRRRNVTGTTIAPGSTGGKHLISLCIVSSKVTSTYGAAGALIIVLVWVYYSALILLLGAEFAKAYSDQRRALRELRHTTQPVI